MRHIKSIDVTVYKFSDLSEKAKRRAINNHRMINVIGTDWLEVTLKNYLTMFPPTFKLSESDTLRKAVDTELENYTAYLDNEFQYYISDDAVALALKDMDFYKDGSDF